MRPALIAAFLFVGPAAWAGCAPGTSPVTSADLRPLWDWVVAAMGLEAEGAGLPHICRAPPEELREMRYGQASSGGLDVVALYDARDGGTIHLSSAASASERAARSVLVHELVHHAQALRSKVYACPQAAEGEAYALQERWLMERGGDLATDFGIDRFTVRVITTCGI